MTIYQPAELNIEGVQKIAVLEFSGDRGGKIAQHTLTSRLFNNGHYILVDQSELDRVATVSDPYGGPPDVRAALDAARQLEVDAILTGEVISYGVADDVVRSQKFEVLTGSDKPDDDHKPARDYYAGDDRHDHHHQGEVATGDDDGRAGIRYENNETVNREAAVSISFQLLDARTGKILAAKAISHDYAGQVTNGDGQLPVRDQLLSQLMNRCADDVLAMLAPHPVPADAPLATVWWADEASDIRSGNAAAQKGDWESAALHYETALKLNPRSHAAMHNLAVAHEARRNYREASRLVEKAIAAGNATMYRTARNRIELGARREARVASQRSTQPTIASDVDNTPPPFQR